MSAEMNTVLTMMILTLCVTGLGLLSSSSASTRAKWLSCQIGRPSRLSLDSYTLKHTNTNVSCKNSFQHFHYHMLHIHSFVIYLQDQRDARGEEGHEDEVIGQDGHAAEAAHDL